MKVSNFFNAFRENNYAMFSKEVNVFGNGSFMEFGYVKLQPEFWESNAQKSFWDSGDRRSFLMSLLSWLSPLISGSSSGCTPDLFMDVPQISKPLPTGLAKSQSYGYFDDIPNSSWELMQQRARSSVQYTYPEEPEKGYKKPILWYLNNLQPDFTCPHVSRVGGHGE
jgi:hypothetical protein